MPEQAINTVIVSVTLITSLTPILVVIIVSSKKTVLVTTIRVDFANICTL